MEDSLIIALFQERNEDALHQTMEKYGAYCHGVAYNILRSHQDSEECVNDTLLRVWNSIPPQRPLCLRAFLGRIARNLAIDRFRSQKARSSVCEGAVALEELGECVSDTATPLEEAEAARLRESIQGFLSGLSRRDREIFLCRYFYSYTVAEIAKARGMKENYVRNLLSRTRQKLKQYLEKEGFAL
ncbi:MAG: RNA polymerase sigma factor [Clostridia bacterium]|nr:RNA polymerase sigma factor [Clostridia bacterium]